MANNARITDAASYLAAGINPKNGLPVRMSSKKIDILDAAKRALRIKDEQTACSRYIWYNTGTTLTSQEIERFLYYRYSLAFFYLEGQFYLMPYALNGGIDFYGRENSINPVPFTDGADAKKQSQLLSTIKLNVIKAPVYESSYENMTGSAVILRDYTPQMNIQKALPRATLQDGIIDLEARCLAYMRTSLQNSTGVTGVKVNDEGEYDDVLEASNSIDDAALSGKTMIPMMSKLDRQDLNISGAGRAQDFLTSMQAVDNFRESLYGLAQGGLFLKSQHTNDSENLLNRPVDFPLSDGLRIRQDFCDIVNSIWGLGIWCEISETALQADKNGDMIADDERSVSDGHKLDQTDEPEDVQ